MFSLKRFGHFSLMISLSMCPFLANAGPGGTGGGDAALSTPKQVEDAISLVKPKLVEWLRVYQIHFNSFTSEAAISKLYKNFYELKPDIDKAISIWGIEQSPFAVKKVGPCIDLKGEEKDAAVQERLEPGSPICFSVSRLTRIPSDQLERQVVALAAHELTHQIMKSLDEGWPLKIQLLVLETYKGATSTEAVCSVNTFRNYKGDVTGYQINFGWLLDCSGGCGTGFTFEKDQLSYFLELASAKHTDPIGRSVGCTTFKFID